MDQMYFVSVTSQYFLRVPPPFSKNSLHTVRLSSLVALVVGEFHGTRGWDGILVTCPFPSRVVQDRHTSESQDRALSLACCSPGKANRDEALTPEMMSSMPHRRGACPGRSRDQYHLLVFRCPEGDIGFKGQSHERLDHERPV